MTNPNTDTVEAVTDTRYVIWSNKHQAWWRLKSSGYTCLLGQAGRYSHAEASAICRDGGRARSGSAAIGPYEEMLIAPECQPRAAIAAMPGNGEAMREAAAKVATAEAWKRREYAASIENGELAQRELAAAQTCTDLAAAIRALPLPQGGGSAAPAGWKLVPIEPTPEMMEVAWSHAPLDMEDMSDGHYGQAYKDMLAAAPLPPAVEPYAWLCTSPELDPVIVYGRENAETYAAHPERWTVEALYRGPKLAAPLPPAQEG